MVRDGAEIRVVDAGTNEDLTRAILSQIIVEETRSRDGGLPIEILRDLIALSDRARREGLMVYLRAAMDTYRKAQHVPMELVRGIFAPKQQDESAEIEDLRQRVEQLDQQLAQKNGRRGRPNAKAPAGRKKLARRT